MKSHVSASLRAGYASPDGSDMNALSGPIQNLRGLVPCSSSIDGSGPDPGKKDREGIEVQAESPVALGTCNRENGAGTSHRVQHTERSFAVTQGFERDAWRHARRKWVNRTTSESLENGFSV